MVKKLTEQSAGILPTGWTGRGGKVVFVEGKIRTERIRKGLADIAKDYSVIELEWIVLLLVASRRIADESESIVPGHHVLEIKRTVEAVFHPSPDPSLFRKAWNELIDTLDSLTMVGLPTMPRAASSEELQKLIHVVGSELDGSSAETQLSIIDDIFYRLVNRWVPTDRRHHEFVAALAQPWIGTGTKAFEFYGTSGELFVQWRRHSSEPVLVAAASNFDSVDRKFAYALRLAARRVRAVQFTGTEPWQGLPFVLIDQASATKPLSRWSDGSVAATPWEGGAAALLAEAARSKPLGVTLLAVVGRQDRHGAATIAHARRELFETGTLGAVIDFDSFAPSGRRVALSAWLMPGSRALQLEGVLFVDARHLLQDRSLADGEQVLRLVSLFVSEWFQHGDHLDVDRALVDAPSRLVRFCKRTFESGYRDVPGFCRVVNHSTLAANRWALRAERYVGPPMVPEWTSGLDTGLIWNQLTSDVGARCLYLIGNNGSGKSLALQELTAALARGNRPSLGLAFGPTDRFEFAPSEMERGFTYLGARTSASGISVKKAMASLGDLVRKTHSEPHRLQAFEDTIARLGFAHRQYLLPLGLRTRSEIRPDVLEDVHPLTLDAASNRGVFGRLSPGQHKLGLMRERESVDSDGFRRPVETIVALDELSSGEQQVLTLIIKVLAHVQPATVVLIDEPEISLHVGWQRQIPAVLDIIATRIGCAFVVATHSPVIIASARHSHDLCFSVSGGRLRALAPQELRSVEATLFEGFDTYTDNTRQIHERCAEIVAQAINDLDADAGGQEKADDAQEPLGQLETLREKLVRSNVADTASGQHDLNLIAKARAAIVELMRSEA